MSKNPLMDIPDIFAPSDGEEIPGLTEDGLLPAEVRRANRAEHQRRVKEYLSQAKPDKQANPVTHFAT